jgi:ABC-type antimicrobial peptide transport system permease subunit
LSYIIEACTKPPRSKKLKQAHEHKNLLINKIETNMLTFEVTKLNMHVNSKVFQITNLKQVHMGAHIPKRTKGAKVKALSKDYV